MVYRKSSVLVLLVFVLISCTVNTDASTPLNLTLTPSNIDGTITTNTATSGDSTNQSDIASVRTGDLGKKVIDNWNFYWSSTPVRTFSFDSEGTAWIGWRGKVIHLLIEDNSYIEFDFDQPYDVNEILIDTLEDVWISTPVFQYDQKQWILFENNYTSPMSISIDNSIWATSIDYRRSDCVVNYDNREWTEFCPKISGIRTEIHDLTVDTENNLWISLRDEFFSNQGVWKLNGDSWVQVDELSDMKIAAYQIAQASDGTLWFVSPKGIETQEKGYIRKYDGKNWITNIENTESVSLIKIAPDNTLWAYASDNTQSYLLKFVGDKWEKVLLERDLNEIFGETVDIYTFDFDPSGKLCLGTNVGLMCRIH